ncbi:hypothetical protein DICPUDRAFT_34297, partial [Dictyostelium purpureum]
DNPGHEEFDALVFMLIIILIVALQVGLFIWKTNYSKSFIKVTLVGLWVFPILYSIYSGFIRFIIFSIIFSSMLGYLFYISTRQPLSRKTPKIIFMWFYSLYLISFIVSILTGFAIVLYAFGLKVLQFDSILTILFYSLYIGLLGRDVAEVCSDRIAIVLGLGGSTLPFTKIPDNYCAICSTNLKPVGSDASNKSLLISDITENKENSTTNKKDESEKIEKRLDKIMNAIFSEKPKKLSCGHMFHEWCIRGWLLVGKKNSCPHCNEKVDIKTTSENPWQSNSGIWATLLDSIRHLIVWNPILLFIAKLIIDFSHYFV